MKLKIDFDELIDAFEQSSVDKHFFIDTKENGIIYINEGVEINASEKLEKMESDRYIHIPPRLPQDEFSIMESFVYQLPTLSLADKFHNTLERKKPFRNFKFLLEQYPKLKEKWFKFKDKEIKNQTINWLCEAKIELPNQKLIQDIEIKELTQNEIEDLPKEIKDFGPFVCLDCDNNTSLKARFFSLNVAEENRLIEKENEKIYERKI